MGSFRLRAASMKILRFSLTRSCPMYSSSRRGRRLWSNASSSARASGAITRSTIAPPHAIRTCVRNYYTAQLRTRGSAARPLRSFGRLAPVSGDLLDDSPARPNAAGDLPSLLVIPRAAHQSVGRDLTRLDTRLIERIDPKQV